MQGEARTTEIPAGRGLDGTAVILLAVTIVLGLAGARLLIEGGRSAITGGILLLIGALAAEAVAFGGRAWGSEVEGSLDLSSRLGLGVLGGILAGLLHALLTLFAGWTDIAVWLGSGIDVQLSAADWGVRLLHVFAWGFLLGLTWRLIPAADFAGKGLAFSLVVSAYVLLIRYPFVEGAGFLGINIGMFTSVLVLIGNALAAVVAAGVIAWGARSPDRPVSQPLVH
jgi:hypothetical protein